MNNMSFMIWFSVYACAMITLGWYVSRKQKTGEDFLLGGRSLPMILTLGSTVGTMVGTGSSVGAVGFGYSNGWAGMLYGLGGATASEAFSALDAGAQWLKIFPSSAFGADYIRALKAVLPPEVPVLAVGGVTPENLATWIQAGCAGAGLGSDLYRAGQAVERTREQAERFISASKS